jgi:hypothetical protein
MYTFLHIFCGRYILLFRRVSLIFGRTGRNILCVLCFKRVPVIHIFRLPAAGEKMFLMFFLFQKLEVFFVPPLQMKNKYQKNRNHLFFKTREKSRRKSLRLDFLLVSKTKWLQFFDISFDLGRGNGGNKKNFQMVLVIHIFRIPKWCQLYTFVCGNLIFSKKTQKKQKTILKGSRQKHIL